MTNLTLTLPNLDEYQRILIKCCRIRKMFPIYDINQLHSNKQYVLLKRILSKMDYDMNPKDNVIKESYYYWKNKEYEDNPTILKK
jgi:hypothetical protein